MSGHSVQPSRKRDLLQQHATRWLSRNALRNLPTASCFRCLRAFSCCERGNETRGSFDCFCAGQKPLSILRCGRPVWRPFRSVPSAWPLMILFGQAGLIILRGSGRGEPPQRLAVVPVHPLPRTLLQFRGVPQQFGHIVERIGAVELARMNQAHEQITDPGTVQRLMEQCVLAIQDSFLQGTLDDIMPRPGLCRVLRPLARPAWVLRFLTRHNRIASPDWQRCHDKEMLHVHNRLRQGAAPA